MDGPTERGRVVCGASTPARGLSSCLWVHGSALGANGGQRGGTTGMGDSVLRHHRTWLVGVRFPRAGEGEPSRKGRGRATTLMGPAEVLPNPVWVLGADAADPQTSSSRRPGRAGDPVKPAWVLGPDAGLVLQLAPGWRSCLREWVVLRWRLLSRGLVCRRCTCAPHCKSKQHRRKLSRPGPTNQG